MKRLLLALGAAVVLLAGIVLIRTVRLQPASFVAEPAPDTALPAGTAERLAGSLRIRTVSHDDAAAFDAPAFKAFHDYVRGAFPRVHAAVRRETVGDHSLLYTWQGSDTTLKPILLAGHIDVVPVEAESEGQWDESPFGGRIAGGFIWGRGAIDNKAAVLGMLESVEMLLNEGFRPARTVLLAFGHDEEVGGASGAKKIAALLGHRGIELDMVLDEGGVIADGLVPGITLPVALVGIAEKGFASVELTVSSAGGHSSLPPRQSAIGILSAAIARLEANPMPGRLEGPTRQFFDGIAPHLPFGQRAAFANLWLTRPLLMSRLAASPTTNAMVRTTMAPTVFHAGTKDNVLPGTARAVVNYRILPGDSIADVLAHIRQVVDDPRVEIRLGGRFSAEPSAVSSTTTESFRTLERVIRRVAPDAMVTPYQVVVVSDARHYAGLCPDVFRFVPLRVTTQDMQRIHGTNERIAIGDYQTVIRFYHELLRDAAAER